MKDWIGKNVKLVFKSDGQISYYTAKIIDVDIVFITFIDKFDNKISKKIQDIELIREEKEVKG